jgi:hypothetical protein
MRDRTLVALASAVAFVLAAATLQAGAFSGTIHYRLTDPKGAVREMSMAISGHQMRSDVQAAGHAMASIIDFDAKTMTTLFAERQAYNVTHFAGAADQAKAAVTAVRTGKTQSIAGYKADEWAVTRNGKASSVWLTTQLGRGFFSPTGPGAMDVPADWKGKDLIMLRATRPGGMSMEATKVDTDPPDAALFSVPEGYTQMKNPFEGAAPDASGPGGAEVAERMKKAMESMSPEQRAAMQKAMQGQPGMGQ